MRNTSILFLFQLMFVCINCEAQNDGQANMYLTNYTTGKENNTVGYVRLKVGEIKSISVGAEYSDLFKISKDHQLSLGGKIMPGTHWLDVTLTVRTSSGTLTKRFRIVKDDFIRNKVVAHRGAWKNTGAPENSVAAFNHAVAGCEAASSMSTCPQIHCRSLTMTLLYKVFQLQRQALTSC